eukprot:845010-Rhodomonas_salina.1
MQPWPGVGSKHSDFNPYDRDPLPSSPNSPHSTLGSTACTSSHVTVSASTFACRSSRLSSTVSVSGSGASMSVEVGDGGWGPLGPRGRLAMIISERQKDPKCAS